MGGWQHPRDRLQGRGGWGVGSGQATHRRFSSPRPRKAPACTVLMTLFLRSLWEASGGFTPRPLRGHAAPRGGRPHCRQCRALGFPLSPCSPQRGWEAG